MDSKDKLVTLEDLKAVHDEVARYTTCSTAAGTAAKTAALTNFVLATGSAVKVKFTNTNTAGNPTLNINSTGAKPIMQYGVTPAGITPPESWNDGAVVEFVYDGTNWIISDAGSQNAIEIPVNADLDTYTTPGLYFCPNSATASTLINSPVTNAGFSFVVLPKSTAYQTQLINSGGYLYYRQRSSSGWSAWYTTAHKEGDTFTGDVVINDASPTTSSEVSILTLGNSTPTGTVGNSNGAIRMYGQGDKYVQIRPITTSGSYASANRTIFLPDAGGTIALDLSESFTGTAMTGGTLNRCTGTIGERPSIYTNGREYYLYGRLTITSFVRTNSNPYITFQTSFRPSHTLYGDTGIRFDDDVAKPEKIAVQLSTTGLLTIQNTETHFNMPTNSVRVIWLFPMLALV